jgi:SPRY domain
MDGIYIYTVVHYTPKMETVVEHGCKMGDTISCVYNASTSEISFEKNGVSLGVAYTNVNGEDIAPAVELHDLGDSTTLSID